MLAKRSSADTEVMRLFALIHDCKRQDDFADSGHGVRAAEFAATIRHLLPALDQANFERLQLACALHSDGQTHPDPTIGTCWDADRLDLTRVGAVPDARLMSTDLGRHLAERQSRFAPKYRVRDPTPNWIHSYGGL